MLGDAARLLRNAAGDREMLSTAVRGQGDSQHCSQGKGRCSALQEGVGRRSALQ